MLSLAQSFVHISIRDIGSGEIVIAKSRYDGIGLLRALENTLSNQSLPRGGYGGRQLLEKERS